MSETELPTPGFAYVLNTISIHIHEGIKPSRLFQEWPHHRLKSGNNGRVIPDLNIVQNALPYGCAFYTLDKQLALLASPAKLLSSQQ